MVRLALARLRRPVLALGRVAAGAGSADVFTYRTVLIAPAPRCRSRRPPGCRRALHRRPPRRTGRRTPIVVEADVPQARAARAVAAHVHRGRAEASPAASTLGALPVRAGAAQTRHRAKRSRRPWPSRCASANGVRQRPRRARIPRRRDPRAQAKLDEDTRSGSLPRIRRRPDRARLVDSTAVRRRSHDRRGVHRAARAPLRPSAANRA